MPPKTITSAVAAETSSSTAGMTAAVRRPASTLALRLSRLTRSKRLLFSSSRERLWITRTPETFSCRFALTTAIACRTRTKACGPVTARRHHQDEHRDDGEGDERKLHVEN